MKNLISAIQATHKSPKKIIDRGPESKYVVLGEYDKDLTEMARQEPKCGIILCLWSIKECSMEGTSS